MSWDDDEGWRHDLRRIALTFAGAFARWCGIGFGLVVGGVLALRFGLWVLS